MKPIPMVGPNYEVFPIRSNLLRMLAVVCKVYKRDGTASLRSIRDEIGYSSTTYVVKQLAILKASGLINYESAKARTIVPLFSYEITQEAFDKVAQ